MTTISDIAKSQKQHLFLTWTAQNKSEPMPVKNAEGSALTLENGKQVLDMCSQSFHANLGHAHPKMREALVKAAEEACALGPNVAHEERAKLGENLARVTPDGAFTGLTKSFLCTGGAEANENAIKMARLITKRYKVITRYRSFHGASIASLAISGDYRRIPFDMAPNNGVIRFPDPYPRGSGQTIDTVKLLEEIIEIEGPETIACILLEGITGANGVFVPDADYWPRIRKLCDRYGILLIADEVLSGFGRTGKWFAVDHFGVLPDMMTMAKGLTAGYAPLSAVVVRDKFTHYFDDNMLWCGLTGYAHPLSCAAANAAIRVYEEEKTIENAAARGKELATYLAKMQKDIPQIAEVRSIGLLAAIDLRKSATDDTPWVPYRATGTDAQKATALAKSLFDAGIYCIIRFGMILLAPPLNISQAELEKGMETLAVTLKKELKS